MKAPLKVLFVDAQTGYYKIKRYERGPFFGPVDLGLHLTARYNTLNIGTGLLAGSIFPGSNRLIFSGFSPCWGGFYISSMGGAGLVFDNLGINLVAIAGKAGVPSILRLNRVHNEEIQVKIVPVDVNRIWRSGRGGIYALMDHAHERFRQEYAGDPRILVVGPASQCTDFGAIASAPISGGKLTPVDTWAGRGGLGTSLFQGHGVAAVVYGGTFSDEDFRDRKVANRWFEDKYNKNLAAKDFEATTKYRFDPKFDTGGTFGVNFSTMGGRMLAFNYRSIYMDEAERLDIHRQFILDHYLKQFNDETIKPKKQKTCGEPCAAVCKKMYRGFKKDYEPYQTMGPLCGIFDQRAAEKLNHQADMYGFDAISAGGVLAWIMECLSENLIAPEEVGVSGRPVFSHENFRIESDSMHNAGVGVELLNAIVAKQGVLDLTHGARRLARRLAREKGPKVLNAFVYNASGRQGWMVPNQYWVPGVLSPMAIMGKYYMYYGADFYPPRELGRRNARHLVDELALDNMGFCRFHRGWAAELIPDIVGHLYGQKKEFVEKTALTAARVNSGNASVFWESARNIDFLYTFLKRRQQVEGDTDAELSKWVVFFEKDKQEAALSFWYEIHKGIQESLREF